jgi:protein CpxP
MKKIIFAIAAVVVLAAGAIFVAGQIKGRSGAKGFGHGRGHMAGMMLRGLNLTDDQKAKVKSIFEAAKTDVQPLREALKENRKKLNSVTANGAFDQAQIQAIADEQGALMSKMIVEREKVKSQIIAILTDEQKAKAAQMRENFKQHMKDHKGTGAKPADKE